MDSEELEPAEMEIEARRPGHDRDVEMEVFDAVRGGSDDPVTPVRLSSADTFPFRCHPGVACWNSCCHGADITLTPYDILRLSRRLGVRPAEFLERHAVPAIFDKTAMPVPKLLMGGADGNGACPFVGAEGCGVYDDRPATCRYYPLGLVSMKMKDAEAKEDFHFIVRERHCLGHDQAKSRPVAEFRREQGVAAYERANRGWVDILMKMASWNTLGGPGGKAPTPQTRKMFFMATTDVDAFRRFVFGTRFLELYEIDAQVAERLKSDDEALLQLAYDWLKAILFNEPTLRLKERVMRDAIAQARTRLGAG